jgi:hypothetical protein
VPKSFRIIVFSFASLVSIGTHHANAQVVALSPTPHVATCADFHPVGNGMWSPNGPISINNAITMSPGVSFGEGTAFGGIDVARTLHQTCAISLPNSTQR